MGRRVGGWMGGWMTDGVGDWVCWYGGHLDRLPNRKIQRYMWPSSEVTKRLYMYIKYTIDQSIHR